LLWKQLMKANAGEASRCHWSGYFRKRRRISSTKGYRGPFNSDYHYGHTMSTKGIKIESNSNKNQEPCLPTENPDSFAKWGDRILDVKVRGLKEQWIT